MRRIFAGAFLIVLLLGTIPLVLTPVYSIRAVHPISTLMLADHFTFRPMLREWVSIDDVAPVIVYSVMMSEDGQFCRHRGIDWGEMRAVVEEALAGEETRGASTIPMQMVKNLFLWNGRSYLRKGLEAPLALYADAILSKRRMMEIYLNIVEWDTGVYGVGAASQHYFGRSAAELNARQAALLAVTLPAPGARSPANPSKSLDRLARRVERLASRSGDYIGCLKPAKVS
ncbi:transglycosylase domain-containing protein [Aurantimonas sp. C2-6-R+9]|uniref:biosynthetic peptidoglycan transglycosylase n=1 Tax=unclassified Aurantimonas TaxID=2638230 RepID=UPI002E19540A|nr:MULTISPECIES: transglycosylase domain-containing protein [unclassified Aurantimonas]MEC5290360.1 transglycosylase domain-containing protein [Aurantimonas sp. C2-3-R2]MEC5379808.1 transglycosylase domain-containing protein [Aurantimonas sp. C2-6-R+9]MEC5411384.1 transglycosylase domain-containing protein [Aurantimonas sp. C2-4-R8]